MHGWDADKTRLSYQTVLILTFKCDLDLWGTSHLIMVNMCVQEHDNPKMHGWDAGLTRKSYQTVLILTFDLVWHWPLRYRPAASSWWTFVPSFFEMLWCMVKMWTGQGTVLSNSTFFNLWHVSVTLTFEGTCLGLVSDTPLIIVNVCAKFLSNPTMHV